MKAKEESREARLRRLAKKKGLRLEKSRVRKTNINKLGGYQIIEVYRNLVIEGVNYELSLDDVEYRLNHLIVATN